MGISHVRFHRSPVVVHGGCYGTVPHHALLESDRQAERIQPAPERIPHRVGTDVTDPCLPRGNIERVPDVRVSDRLLPQLPGRSKDPILDTRELCDLLPPSI
jgi:hypothetical protein